MNKNTQKWHERFTTAETQQTALFERVSKYYDIMYAVQNTSNMAPWRAKVYIPVLASKAWDLVSRLSNVLPYFQTKVDDVSIGEDGNFEVPEDVLARQRRLDAKLRKDYVDSPDPMKLKVSDTLLDAVVAGTGWAKVSWETREDKRYSKETDEDGMIKNAAQDIVETYNEGYNCFEPINFFNVFVSPNAPSWAKSNYMIVRYFKPFHELEKNGNYDLNKLTDQPVSTTFDSNNAARNKVLNDKTFIQADPTVKTATVYECYERKADGIYMSTYAEGSDKNNGWVQIRAEAKRYWHTHFPIVPFYIRRKTFSPFGESLFENNATLQSATNDLFNHYLDNLNVSLDSMIMYEDGTLTNDFIVEPGGEITYTGEAPKQFKFPEPNPAQITSVMGQLEKAIEIATVPQYISGVPDSSTDKTAGTAKGISLITEAATEKIGFMKDNFKQSMTIVGKIELSNLAQFQDKPEMVSYTEGGQSKPDIITPSDYQGRIELTIDDDSMLPLTKDERRDNTLQGIAQLKSMQDSAIQQATLFKEFDNVPKIEWGEAMDDVAQLFFSKDTSRYLKRGNIPVPQSPEEAQSIASGGGQSSGQNPIEAAMQGMEGAPQGNMSQPPVPGGM